MCSSSLPVILAGPILRFVDENQLTVWLVSSSRQQLSLQIGATDGNAPEIEKTESECLPVGKAAYVYLLQTTFVAPLRAGEKYHYDIHIEDSATASHWQQEKRELLYTNENHLSFRWQPKLSNVLHGSCRKPHHPADDALVRVDELIADECLGKSKRPDLLLLTGDQVYADDVAGPMVQAIQQVINLLGLFQEPLKGAIVNHSDALPDSPYNLYRREQILPQISTNTVLSKIFFGAKKKPVFTSVNAQNHLIAFAEIMAMYLLVWSPVLWRGITFNKSAVNHTFHARFEEEEAAINGFCASLPKVRRAMAHIPVYMIFDDHDVTDDWNLNRGWEEEVYGHPLSRRMVGNALMGYWLCQGWGNKPDKFAAILTQAKQVFTDTGLKQHDKFIDTLFDFEDWHYNLQTQPPLHVLDTRTRRWRSESSLHKPSGLMDWEALCEFQQDLIGQQSVIVVSAAPIYGVKMIETIQKVFTFFGKALTVDAENWMAHRGTAHVMLNIFRHYNTPPQFIILSGDVHYSFVYDVRLRFRRNSPRITQFTCSGLKNTFPRRLLNCLDTCNRWFYGPTSPLNIFTRRRNMSVTARPPSGADGSALLNHSAIGQLVIHENGTTVTCNALCSGGETVEFPTHDEQ
ncbi:alkaline phosphatase family protein [Alteromonas pelagimontana]|uniref:Alkaline phosphatase family protein n=1 Tax=Alteromonas pelagimontana TaxID=1858656 RepID=A0A6M4MI40_9ALTE|nr:alkaline phosphatase family protein [Alteromonas pelagimontana]